MAPTQQVVLESGTRNLGALPSALYGCPYPPSRDGGCQPPPYCNCYNVSVLHKPEDVNGHKICHEQLSLNAEIAYSWLSFWRLKAWLQIINVLCWDVQGVCYGEC